MQHSEIYTLEQIRTDFGWSQKALAHRIGVSESTIRRWEKRKTKEPLISAITRKTNRRLHYLLAMVDKATLSRVENSNDHLSLHHGDDLMLIACSQRYLADNPSLRMLIGVPVVPLLMGKAARQFSEKRAEIAIALRKPGTTALWVTEDIAPSAIVSRGKVMNIHVLAPGLALSEGRHTDPKDLPARIEINHLR